MKTFKEFVTEAKFISNAEYNAVTSHVSKKHPGYEVHAIGRDHVNGGINYMAYHKDDTKFKNPIKGTFKN